MAFLTSCLCCSLLTGSITSGIIACVLYTVAFVVELWWIVEANIDLPVPAFILAAGYLTMSVLSMIMLAGLRTKRTKFLLSWVLLMVLYIFPEAGMVLFMSCFHWKGVYGVVELSLWVIRILFNICGIICVQSMWAFWRDEKSVFRSLHELSITNGALTGGLVDHGMGIPGEYQKKIRGSMRIGYPPQQNGYPPQQNGYPPQQNGYHPNGQQNGYHPNGQQNGYNGQQLGYNNPAFTTSSSHINGSLSVTKYGNNNSKHLKRSISSASQYVSASRLSLTNVGLSQGLGYLPQPVGYLSQPISYRSSQHGGLSKNEFNTSLFNSGVLRTHSQFDLPSFGLDPDAPIFHQGGYGPGGLPVNVYMGNSRHGKSGNQTMEWYRPRSLVNLEDDNASIWSGGYGGNYADYSTQSLDRRKMRNGGLGHRAQSMGALNMGYMSEEEFRRTAVGSVSGQLRPYHLQNGSKQSLGQQSDSPERYRDIAL